MGHDDLLGPANKRPITIVRLPKAIKTEIKKLCRRLGIPSNAFYALAAIYYYDELSRMRLLGQKRLHVFTEMENIFKKIFEELKKPL